MNIEKIDNGYLIKDQFRTNRKADTLEEVCDWLLLHFEGRGKFFGGDSFGKVVILYKPTKEYPEVEPI
jgi:hypothetical protein